MWQPCCTERRAVQPRVAVRSNCTTTTNKTTMPVERVDSTSPPAILRAHEEATTGVHKKHRPGHDVKLPAVMLTSKFNNMMSCCAASQAAAQQCAAVVDDSAPAPPCYARGR